MKHLRIAGVVIGLAAYAAAFYATPLPDVRNDAGQPLWRFDLLWLLLFRPDETLLPTWFGAPAGFSLLDRLPVLLVAGAILAWAIVLGWLLMKVVGAYATSTKALPPSNALPLDWEGFWPLTRLEVFVFSAAVGLNAVSTWVLLMGLLGVMGRLATFVAPALLTLVLAAYLWRRKNSQSCERSPGTSAGAKQSKAEVVCGQFLAMKSGPLFVMLKHNLRQDCSCRPNVDGVNWSVLARPAPWVKR